MKVLHLSTHDTHGGAARSAYRLHQGLLEAGVDSQMLVLYRHSKDPTVTSYTEKQSFLRRAFQHVHSNWINASFKKYADTRPAGLELFSGARTPYALKNLKPSNAAVINLHWVAGFVDYEQFFLHAAARQPVVWRLSDLNPITGGCHYDHGCGKYLSGCGACPQLGSHTEKDLSYKTWQQKQAIFERINPDRLHFVAQSEWIKKQVQRSDLVKRFPVSVIPNGLDTGVFAPRNREAVRVALGIPQTARVLLFVAQSLTNRRKGFGLLAEALRALKDVDDLYLLSVGEKEFNVELSIPQLHLGVVSSDRLLPLAYNTADIFVIPSLQDNLPNTVLESIACGTPVVGFNVGGIPDMVREGQTGWLVPGGDIRALCEVIKYALNHEEERKAMSRRCRDVAVAEYDLEIQVQRYVSLYESLLA